MFNACVVYSFVIFELVSIFSCNLQFITCWYIHNLNTCHCEKLCSWVLRPIVCLMFVFVEAVKSTQSMPYSFQMRPNLECTGIHTHAYKQCLLNMLQACARKTIKGFHVTSYQANFASHLTRDRHVGFLSPQSGIRKYNKMSQNFLFSSYHYTKLQQSDKIVRVKGYVRRSTHL